METKTYTLDTLKATLIALGHKNFFVHKKGHIVIRNSNAVKVQINITPQGAATVAGKFPQIGSSVQVVTTILLFIIGPIVGLPYPLISAVLIGQLISVAWFLPKVNALKKEIETLLS